MPTPRLIDSYDGAYFDLDGVLYLDSQPVVGAIETQAVLRAAGVPVAYVTNNAALRPSDVAHRLQSIDICADPAEVVVASQAIANLMERELDAGAPVLVVGTAALAEQIARVGLVPVKAGESAAAVVQGYHPELPWDLLEAGCLAIKAGAKFYASNLDLTRPTSRGEVPGAGAQVAALSAATGATPTVAGKPYPPLLRETLARTGCRRPIMVGDRLDTDIAGANQVHIDSLFVCTGVHGMQDLLDAPPLLRPTHIGADTTALLLPARRVRVDGDRAVCNDQVVARTQACTASADLETDADDIEAQLDALWALLQLAWRDPELDPWRVVSRLNLLH